SWRATTRWASRCSAWRREEKRRRDDMSATLMDGRAVSAAVRDKLALRVQELEARGVKPHLAVVLVGEDPASQIYVRNKERACEKLGIRSTVLRLAAECTQQELEDAVRTLS